MRIPKCVDCRWHPDEGQLCQHPDASLDPITGKPVRRRSMAAMRYGGDCDLEAAPVQELCGIVARLFDYKVDPFRR